MRSNSLLKLDSSPRQVLSRGRGDEMRNVRRGPEAAIVREGAGRGNPGGSAARDCQTDKTKDELKTGTYHAMLKQLGITETDLM